VVVDVDDGNARDFPDSAFQVFVVCRHHVALVLKGKEKLLAYNTCMNNFTKPFVKHQNQYMVCIFFTLKSKTSQ
jgi:hypothetical protein